MSNRLFNKELEEIAVSLREILEFTIDKVFEKDDIYVVIDKIVEHFENIKIKSIFDYWLLELRNNQIFNIYFGLNEKADEQLYMLISFFAYTILFDKKTLNEYEKKQKLITVADVLKDKDAQYLALAFIMPEKLFYESFIKHSKNDGSVDIFEMEKELKNKYVYRRGLDLGYWVV